MKTLLAVLLPAYVAAASSCFPAISTTTRNETVVVDTETERERLGTSTYEITAQRKSNELRVRVSQAEQCRIETHRIVEHRQVRVKTLHQHSYQYVNYGLALAGVAGGAVGFGLAPGLSNKRDIDEKTGEEGGSSRDLAYVMGSLSLATGIGFLITGLVHNVKAQDVVLSARQNREIESSETVACGRRRGAAVPLAYSKVFGDSEGILGATDNDGELRVDLVSFLPASYYWGNIDPNLLRITVQQSGAQAEVQVPISDLAESAVAAELEQVRRQPANAELRQSFQEHFAWLPHAHPARREVEELAEAQAAHEWSLLGKQADVAELRAFLARHGNSTTASLARTRLAECQWQALQSETLAEPLEQYAEEFPEAPYAQVAIGRARALRLARGEQTSDVQALQALIDRYADSPEAMSAASAIVSIYLDRKDLTAARSALKMFGDSGQLRPDDQLRLRKRLHALQPRSAPDQEGLPM